MAIHNVSSVVVERRIDEKIRSMVRYVQKWRTSETIDINTLARLVCRAENTLLK
jgi:hypothetical protein